MLSEFGKILIFFIVGVMFIGGGLITAWLVRPNRPNDEKLSTYESGEEVVSNAWGKFNIRFYVIALIFLLFDVEIALLFPWAVVFGNEQLILETDGLWGWLSLIEMVVFVLILAIGLAYAWSKGYLNWEKPNVEHQKIDSPVPTALYKQVNDQYQKD